MQFPGSVKAIMPSVGEVIVEASSKDELKRQVCEYFDIEEEWTELLDIEDSSIAESDEHEDSSPGLTKSVVLVDYLWARQKILIKDGQKKLRGAKVTVVGAGALGCELVKNLALTGIGSIVVVDHDTIEFSNLSV